MSFCFYKSIYVVNNNNKRGLLIYLEKIKNYYLEIENGYLDRKEVIFNKKEKRLGNLIHHKIDPNAMSKKIGFMEDCLFSWI